MSKPTPSRVFKTRIFIREMKKSGLTDAALLEAVAEMAKGLNNGDLTGTLPTAGRLLKKRVALPGKGKRGSARTIVATSKNNQWFFLFGFVKNETDDLTHEELNHFREAAERLLTHPEAQLARLIETQELEEITHV